jgi:hypothetical protein
MARDIPMEVVIYSAASVEGLFSPRRRSTYNAIHPVVSNEEAVMADTRLKAVATAESPRTLFVGTPGSATVHTVGGPGGHPGSGVSAATASRAARASGFAHFVFAYTSPPQRPTSVRAGTALRPGAPRLRQWPRTGLPRSRHVRTLGALRTDALRVRVAHTPGMVPMGADRDRFIVEPC